MTKTDDELGYYEVREVIARFDDVTRFEAAVEQLEDSGISSDDIHMMASHETVRKKLGHHFDQTQKIDFNESSPQAIYEDKHDIASEKALAVGVPVYIGCVVTGLAVVATGGTLAFAALAGAAGAAVGGGVGGLIARVIGKKHAALLQDELAKGVLLVMVEVKDADEARVIAMLQSAGGQDVKAHTLTRYAVFDEADLTEFSGRNYDFPSFYP